MSLSPDREALLQDLMRQLRKQMESQPTEEDLTLDQIEKMAGELGQTIAQETQRRLAEQQSKKRRPKRLDCACGTRTLYKGQQPRTLVTSQGPLRWQRACYYCPTCHKTVVPADDALGLDGGCTTAQVRLWVAWLASLLPFAQATTTLQMLTPVALSAATLERIAVTMGQALGQSQQQQAQRHRSGKVPEPDFGRALRRLYIGMDGLFVPLRDPWKRDGTQGDLSCRFAECKIGVVYQTEQDPKGQDHRVRVQDYTATLQGVDVFGPLLGTLAHQQGHHAAQEVVVLGDGAAWIWQLAAQQFPGAVQVIDFFHACDHLATYAEVRFGKESAEGKAWQKARQTELKEGQMPQVLRAIAAWRPSNPQKHKLRRDTYRYFYNNAQRMRYQTFLKKGYHIGSGVVEASCKHVIGQRMDQAGMHWRQQTAEAIATLRAAQLSSHPTDLKPFCYIQ